jgi:hypothetical protein
LKSLSGHCTVIRHRSQRSAIPLLADQKGDSAWQPFITK